MPVEVATEKMLLAVSTVDIWKVLEPIAFSTTKALVELVVDLKRAVPTTERFANGLVEPMPTKPAVEINIDDVPTAVLVPLKYASWPVVPVSEAPLVARQVPFTA